ncbi:MAG TPA: diacylglycerol kinase family protein [Candidatus Angelobacter sp.]|nr:diacylglycerol kinase family protein [Candidatus Angelobacter sp.]
MEASSTTLSILIAARPLVLVNPQAGGGRARAYLPRLQELFRSFRISAEWKTTDSAEALQAAAREAISANHRVLFAVGGDGTFQALANAAYGTDVILGLLPSGGGNDFAAAAGIPNHPVKAAEALVRGRVRPVDLVQARTADGRTRLYAGGGGVGLDVEAARLATGNYRHLPGRIRYVAAGLRALVGFKPPLVRLEFPECDLGPAEARCLLTGVLNTPTYGAGLRLAPEATIDDGLLHIVQIADLGMWGVLRLLPRVIRAGEVRTTRIRRWQAKRVRLSTETPCAFHGDGEVLGPTPVEIEVVPKAIQVLVPLKE